MGYSFTFSVTPPLRRDVFEAWHVAFEDGPNGHYEDNGTIELHGHYRASGRRLSDYFTALQAWALEQGSEVKFENGDFVPQGYIDPDPDDPDDYDPLWP